MRHKEINWMTHVAVPEHLITLNDTFAISSWAHIVMREVWGAGVMEY